MDADAIEIAAGAAGEELPMKHLFITEADTPLGRRVVQHFAKTGEYRIVATTRDPRLVTKRPPSHLTSDGHGGEAERLPVADTPPPWIAAVVPQYDDDPVEFKAQVLDADVVVCPLRDTAREATAAIRILSNTPYDVEKTFVLVSSVLTWANTAVAEKAEAKAEREAARREAIEAGDLDPDEEEEEPEEEEPPTYTEDAYMKRVPHQRYQHWKELEQLTKMGNSETLHTYVLFAGLTYGGGEELMQPMLDAAWHGRPLPLYSGGANVVPMIHIDDLATAVFRLGTELAVLESRYVIAVDRGSATTTWGQVVGALNKAMGTGETVVATEERRELPHGAVLGMDLRMESSALGDVMPDDEDWVAPEGYVAAVAAVVREYRAARGLTPVRVAVVGPPHSGKSALSARMATQYRLPHVTYPALVTDYEAYQRRLEEALRQHRQKRRDERLATEAAAAAEEAEEARRHAAEEDEEDEGKEERVEEEPAVEERDDFEVVFAVKEAPAEEVEEDGEEGEEGEAEPEVAEPDLDADDDEDDEELSKLKADAAQVGRVLGLRTPAGRFGDGVTATMLRWRLQQPDCRNRGYVLDGLPKTVRQAVWAFGAAEDDVPLPEPDEDGVLGEEDEVDADAATAGADEQLLLDSAVVTTCDEAILVSRCAAEASDVLTVGSGAIPQAVSMAVASTTDIAAPAPAPAPEGHTTLANFYRRLEEYKARNRLDRKPHKSVEAWLRAATTADEENPRAVSVAEFDTGADNDACEPTLTRVAEFLGAPHYVRPTAAEIVTETREAAERAAAVDLARLREEEVRLQAEREVQAAHDKVRRNDERRLRSVAEERATAASQVTALPLEEYMMRLVVPAVTGAMAQVAKQRPADPIDRLGDLLFHADV